jgi:hypothetical protein
LLSQHYTWLPAARKDLSHNATFFQDMLATEKLSVQKILDLGILGVPLLEAFFSSVTYSLHRFILIFAQ